MLPGPATDAEPEFTRMNQPIESYEQAIEYLFTRINYERISGMAYSADDFKLDRMRDLLALLDAPHEEIPAVHIAGTKGKGSTAAMIASVLTASGYRTGLFTSPHISAFEERIAVNGQIATPGQIFDLVNAIRGPVAALEKTASRMSPTYFEIATAMAWLFFRWQHVQIAVLEVGLGGRLDATNLCRPEVTVITTISRDHTRQLGSRIEQIAREKAGIVKTGAVLVSGVAGGEAAAAIAAVCREQSIVLRQGGRDFSYRHLPVTVRQPAAGATHGTPSERGRVGAATTPRNQVDVSTASRVWRGLELSLVGEHQAANAAVAVATIEQLILRGWRVSEAAVYEGLAGVSWPGRIEVLRQQPTVIADAAHNWAAVAALLKTIDRSFESQRQILVFAATQDKDVAGMLRQLLPRFDTVILTCYQNNPRGVPVDDLARLAGQLGPTPAHCAADPISAWKLARRLATDDDLICITGSFFIAAELREMILDETRHEEAGTQPAPTGVAREIDA